MTNAIEIKNVSKKYGKRIIFSNLNINIEEGKMIALVGPSGCGKSTLLNMIGLLESYDNGEIKILGKELPKIESRAATLIRRNTINYLFQSFALINDMTVCDNLFLAMNFMNLSNKEKLNKINQMLEQVNLIHVKNELVNTLSGGEQQRVALARTILKPGNIILADEPTGSLDTASANNAFDLIKSLCDHYGKTVLMVTHNTDLANKAHSVIDLSSIQTAKKI